MPELPDVEIHRRHLERSAIGKRVRDVSTGPKTVFKHATPQTLSKRLEGGRLIETTRRGKLLGTRVEGRGWMLMHFGMTGSLEDVGPDEEAPRFTKLELRFEGGEGLCYINKRRLGWVGFTEVFEDAAREHAPGIDALGVTRDQLAELLRGRRGTIKGFLLDQNKLSGVGNVYADETLFHAKLDPHQSPAELTGKQITTLHREMRRVLEKAIEKGARPHRMPRTWLLPKRDAGSPCPRCGGTIKEEQISGRVTRYCPNCQAPGG